MTTPSTKIANYNSPEAIDLAFWSGYIKRAVGFVLPPAQYRWLGNAVFAVMNELQLDEKTLMASLDEPAIYQKLIDAILIPETRFFRDKSVVGFVEQAFENHLMTSDKPFVLVSVGCSTGQEIWSLAMALEQKRVAYTGLYNKPACEFELVGVDASMKSLMIAQSAIYNQRAFGEIPRVYHRFWRVWGREWRLVDTLQQKASFIKCNVFSQDDFEQKLASYRQTASLVLCQNMLIYFRRFDQQAILARMTSLIKMNGFLVLGAGEGVFWQQADMARLDGVAVNAWQKLSG